MNDDFFEYILKLFKCKKKKPQTGRDLKILYVSFLKNICYDIIISKKIDKIIKKQRNKTTKYFLNLEKINLSLELNKFINLE